MKYQEDFWPEQLPKKRPWGLVLIVLGITLMGLGIVVYFHKPKFQPVFNIPKQTVTSSSLSTLVNQQRTKELSETVELDLAAQQKCSDMQTRNYWAHSINGEAFNRFDPPGAFYGENLARNYQDDAAVVQAWLNSPEHRANLLNPYFSLVGYAHCQGPVGNLVVQELEEP